MPAEFSISLCYRFQSRGGNILSMILSSAVMPYLVLLDLVHEDKIWQPYFVRTKYGSHILSSWTKSGYNIWSPLAIFCPPIIIPLFFVQTYCTFIQKIIATCKQLYFARTKYNCYSYILSRRLYIMLRHFFIWMITNSS